MLGYIVLVLAVAGAPAFAGDELTFPEVARGAARIVSGWEAQEGQIPHQISLRMVNPGGGVSSCGASLIHHEWALTAAHCTAARVSLVLRFGTVNLTRPALIQESTEYYNHPSYNEAFPSVVQPNDIGVIKLRRPVEYTDLIKPVRIQRSADKDKSHDRVQMTASGWGLLWTQATSPENLNWVYLLGVENSYCRVRYGFSSIIQDSTICASAYNVSSQSTCQGDSGGPLTVVDVDGQLSVVGVTSFVSGTGCHTDFPAGFIRAGYYHDWYYQLTGINFDWDPEEAGSGEDSSEGSNENSTESSNEDSNESSNENSNESSSESSSGSSSESSIGSSESTSEEDK
uniref:Trypsin-like serine proteinase T26 n=1 Tax=Ostrinia nubilalis TaxID=29057 RepID=B6D1R0_OSTNU|nr:trypsin-like serine proteinase T26 [Ostrinia nubilalis]